MRKIFLIPIVLSLTISWLFPLDAAVDVAATANNKKDTKHKKDHNIRYSPALESFTRTVKKDDTVESPWSVVVVAGAGVVPKYPGSSTQIGMGYGGVGVTYKRRVFLNLNQGLGVYFLNNKSWKMGTAVSYKFYTSNYRSREFPGLNDVPNPVMANFFANYIISLVSVGVTANKAIDAMHGAGYYQALTVFALPINQKMLINFGVTAQYDDAGYLQASYGVTSQESINSTLPVYNTTAGWDNISYSITPIYRLNQHWTIMGSLTEQTFLAQVAKSPLIKQTNGLIATIGCIYKIM